MVGALRLQARTSTSIGGAKELVAGVRLLAVSGRPVAPGELDGPGVATLTARRPAAISHLWSSAVLFENHN